MANDVPVTLKAIAAPDGTNASLVVGPPIDKTYTGVIAGSQVVIVIPAADVVLATEMSYTATPEGSTKSKSGNFIIGEASLAFGGATISLSASGSSITGTVTLQSNAPCQFYWRVVGESAWNTVTPSEDSSSYGAPPSPHVQSFTVTTGEDIEVYAADHIGDTYRTEATSITVSAVSSADFSSLPVVTAIPTADPNTSLTPPAYGATVSGAIANFDIVGVTPNGKRHAYSRRSPWNRDNTLFGNETGEIFGTDDYTTKLYQLPFNTEWVWSRVNPRITYGCSGANFSSYNLDTGVTELIATMPNSADATIGQYEGDVSDDDRYVALSGGSAVYVVDISNKQVIGSKTTDLAGYNNCSISNLGGWVVLEKNNTIYRYNRSMGDETLLGVPGGHSDCGLDINGEEVYAAIGQTVTWARLRDGLVTTIDAGNTSNGHISGRASIGRPGWFYLTQYSPANGTNGGLCCKMQLRYDGVIAIIHWEPSRSDLNFSSFDYNQIAKGAASMDGTKLCVDSHWHYTETGAGFRSYSLEFTG